MAAASAVRCAEYDEIPAYSARPEETAVASAEEILDLVRNWLDEFESA